MGHSGAAKVRGVERAGRASYGLRASGRSGEWRDTRGKCPKIACLTTKCTIIRIVPFLTGISDNKNNVSQSEIAFAVYSWDLQFLITAHFVI